MIEAQPDFDLAELVAKAIDLSMDAQPIQRPALQLKVQALAIAQETRVFPAALSAMAVAQSRIHSRKENVQLVVFGAQLPVFGLPIIPAVTILIRAAGFIGLSRRRYAPKSEQRHRGG